ncbi:MAG: hypothetical protein RIS82_866 [Actinomycetota bacterium]|jgi:leader peptidase (prepilin peptidase)/N-methyltransferase
MKPEDWFALCGVVYLAAVAIPLSIIDVREHRLPNRLVLPALPIALAGQATACFMSADWPKLWLAMGAGGAAFILGLLANRYASLGMGDVKLMAVLSVALTWYSPVLPLVALFLALAAATMVVLPKLLFRRLALAAQVPLGPYLLGGAFSSFASLWVVPLL